MTGFDRRNWEFDITTHCRPDILIVAKFMTANINERYNNKRNDVTIQNYLLV